MRLERVTASIAIAATSVLVAACGSGTRRSTHHTGTAASLDAIRFSQCMRRHGLSDFPDAIVGQGLPIEHEADGSVDIVANGSAEPISGPAYNRAIGACGAYLPTLVGNGVGPSTGARMQDAMVQTATCMRRHGVPNYPDPPALGSVHVLHTSLNGRALSAGIDVDSPAFKAAALKCGSIISNATNGG
jgi:hypothetical protein